MPDEDGDGRPPAAGRRRDHASARRTRPSSASCRSPSPTRTAPRATRGTRAARPAGRRAAAPRPWPRGMVVARARQRRRRLDPHPRRRAAGSSASSRPAAACRLQPALDRGRRGARDRRLRSPAPCSTPRSRSTSSPGYEPGDAYMLPPPRAPFAEAARTRPGPPAHRVRHRGARTTRRSTTSCAARGARRRRAARVARPLGRGGGARTVDPEQLRPRTSSRSGSARPATSCTRSRRCSGEPLDRDRIEPLTRQMAEIARSMSATDFLSRSTTCAASRAQIVRFWDSYDVLVTPDAREAAASRSARCARPRARSRSRSSSNSADWVPFTPVWNVTGQPAISLPLPESAGAADRRAVRGAPAAEDALLSLAAQLEEARPWADRRPRCAHERRAGGEGQAARAGSARGKRAGRVGGRRGRRGRRLRRRRGCQRRRGRERRRGRGRELAREHRHRGGEAVQEAARADRADLAGAEEARGRRARERLLERRSRRGRACRTSPRPRPLQVNMSAPAGGARQRRRARGRAPRAGPRRPTRRRARAAAPSARPGRARPTVIAAVVLVGAEDAADEEVAALVLRPVRVDHDAEQQAARRRARAPRARARRSPRAAARAPGRLASSCITLPSQAVITISGPIGRAPCDTHGRTSTPRERRRPPRRVLDLAAVQQHAAAGRAAPALARPPTIGSPGWSSPSWSSSGSTGNE